jgi:hypothetical protein
MTRVSWQNNAAVRPARADAPRGVYLLRSLDLQAASGLGSKLKFKRMFPELAKRS